ncbi:hypothetical protein OG749_01345 [Streptomyces nojiriensis]|uniref:hypothetical protein n=1 Tax=Streptomyces nojiriensis TaxID=66374 RepID=UPI002E196660
MSLLALPSRSDHGCHEVSKQLPSGANPEDGRLPWMCLFTAGLTAAHQSSGALATQPIGWPSLLRPQCGSSIEVS